MASLRGSSCHPSLLAALSLLILTILTDLAT